MTANRGTNSTESLLDRVLPRHPPRILPDSSQSATFPVVSLFVGGLLSGVIHALIQAGVTTAFASPSVDTPHALASRSSYGIGYGLCGERRCSAPEARQRRRKPADEPVRAPAVLNAELVPRLGLKEQEKQRLPELQAYEQREIVKDGVNLERDNKRPEKALKKRFKARKARLDAKNRSIRDLLDHVDDDPRKRARSLRDIVGSADGEITGEGTVKRPGNRYVRRVRRELEREFVVPTHISSEALSTLKVRIKVQQMAGDGAIMRYKIIVRSGNRGFDDAVLRLLVQYVPEEKGKKRLPVPDPDVLRYINLKGMKIDLLGARLR